MTETGWLTFFTFSAEQFRDDKLLTPMKCFGSGCCITFRLSGKPHGCLSEDFQRLHPDKVWSKAVGMRNILVHHYFEIDAEQIWKVVDGPRSMNWVRTAEMVGATGLEPVTSCV